MRCAGKRCDDQAVAAVQRGNLIELACARCAAGVLLLDQEGARVLLLRTTVIPRPRPAPRFA